MKEQVIMYFFCSEFCGRDGTVNMISGKGRPLTQTLGQLGKCSPLMQFECRGFEPLDFVFGSGWEAESVSLFMHLICL